MMNNNKIYRKYIKRILDVIIGIIALIVASVPMMVVAIGILLAEGRPVFFKQLRVGQDCKTFQIIKFRTMVKNAEQIGPKSTETNDSRITKIGKILRKTSLDELPQIINVLKGDMSIIGYRPDVVRDEALRDIEKYKIKPGITGYAQINGRSSLTIEEVEKWEQQYLVDISFKTDVYILAKTFGSVLFRSGSN